MIKIGCEKIKETRGYGARQKCINCGKKGTHRVTFENKYGRVTILLCERCSKKEYDDLRTQQRLWHPVT